MTAATTSRPRTRRNERGTYASDGAVAQEGKLPIYDCTACAGEVVWATSNRTGRKYLVNVRRGESGARYYMKHDLHDCAPANAARAAYIAEQDANRAKVAECNLAAKALHDAAATWDWITGATTFSTAVVASFMDYLDTDPTILAAKATLNIT